MKRESGEKPEQTRCCKLRNKFSNNTRITIHKKQGWEERSEMEQVRRPAEKIESFVRRVKNRSQ